MTAWANLLGLRRGHIMGRQRKRFRDAQRSFRSGFLAMGARNDPIYVTSDSLSVAKDRCKDKLLSAFFFLGRHHAKVPKGCQGKEWRRAGLRRRPGLWPIRRFVW